MSVVARYGADNDLAHKNGANTPNRKKHLATSRNRPINGHYHDNAIVKSF
jgi:hypothetical protein